MQKRVVVVLLAVLALVAVPAACYTEGAGGDVITGRNFGGSGEDCFQSVIAVSGGFVAVG